MLTKEQAEILHQAKWPGLIIQETPHSENLRKVLSEDLLFEAWRNVRNATYRMTTKGRKALAEYDAAFQDGAGI